MKICSETQQITRDIIKIYSDASHFELVGAIFQEKFWKMSENLMRKNLAVLRILKIFIKEEGVHISPLDVRIVQSKIEEIKDNQ